MQLAYNEPELPESHEQTTASRVAGQTELEQDIMTADGSYFIPVDSGSIETKTMTVMSSTDGSATGIDDDDTREDFTEVAFAGQYHTTHGVHEDQAQINAPDTSTHGSPQSSEQPQLDHLVEMLEQKANGVSSVGRKLSESPPQGTAPHLQGLSRTIRFITWICHLPGRLGSGEACPRIGCAWHDNGSTLWRWHAVGDLRGSWRGKSAFGGLFSDLTMYLVVFGSRCTPGGRAIDLCL